MASLHFKMSLSNSIAVLAGFTKCHDIKDHGYMHNSITCTIQAYIREQGYSKLPVRLHIVYVVLLYLLYFQYMLGYTVHLIEVYSKLPI